MHPVVEHEYLRYKKTFLFQELIIFGIYLFGFNLRFIIHTKLDINPRTLQTLVHT